MRGTKAESPDRAEEEYRRFSFLTCEANGNVGPVHPKAMPVLLTTPEEWSTWFAAPSEITLELQRLLPDAIMRIVATSLEGSLETLTWRAFVISDRSMAEPAITEHIRSKGYLE